MKDSKKILNQHKAQINEQRQFQQKLFVEAKTAQMQSGMRILLLFPICTMVFFTLTASYAIYFAVNLRESWYFAFAGGVVAFFSVLFLILSICQIKQIISLDYQASHEKLQKDILQVRKMLLDNLRLAAWLLPFGPFVGVFVGKAIFNFDLAAVVTLDFLVSFGSLTIVLEVITFFILKRLSHQKIHRYQILQKLSDNSNHLKDALTSLEEIKSNAAEDVEK
jgi:hypothetical protein